MENKNLKATTYKKLSFYDRKTLSKNSCETNAEIRLGITIADEKAKQESVKRRIDAPLTIEEKILLGK